MVSKADSSGTGEWEKLGGRLREIREYLNFSQQYVSDRTGIPRSAISDIERGERKVDSLELKKLARLYRYPVGYFLDEQTDADAGDHAAALLARRLTSLTDADRDQVMRFAAFLTFSHQAENEHLDSVDTESASPPEATGWTG
jgi:transcriptional regulator with XRE-family HTH domain